MRMNFSGLLGNNERASLPEQKWSTLAECQGGCIPVLVETLSKKGVGMELLVWLAVVVFLGWWCYKSGKSIGSRKGYGVGRARGHRRR